MLQSLGSRSDTDSWSIVELHNMAGPDTELDNTFDYYFIVNPVKA